MHCRCREICIIESVVWYGSLLMMKFDDAQIYCAVKLCVKWITLDDDFDQTVFLEWGVGQLTLINKFHSQYYKLHWSDA